MADFGRAKERAFGGFLKLNHAIPSHNTFSTMFRLVDPKVLDAAFGRMLAESAAQAGNGEAIAIDAKAQRGAREKSERARTQMMVSADAARLGLTLATVAADNSGELEAALKVLDLFAVTGQGGYGGWNWCWTGC